MATTQTTVRYRPLRIGFLVPSGDIDALVKVAGINSLLWGGVRNPIIPLGQDRTFAKQLMRLFNVDVLSPAVDSQDITRFMEEYPYVQTMGHLAEKIFYEDWRTKRSNVAVLDTIHLIDHYWRTDFRNRPAGFTSPFGMIDWTAGDPSASAFAVSFGHFHEAQNLRDDFRTAFKKGLRAQVIRINPAAAVPTALAEMVHVLGLTEQRLEEYGGSWREDGLYVGRSSDFEDLLNFWNLRAAGIGLQYLPLDQVDRFRDFVQAYLNQLDAVPSRIRNDVGSIGIHSTDANRDAARDISRQFTVRKSYLYSTCSAVIWNGLNVTPTRAYFSHHTVLADVDCPYGRYAVSFAFPPKPVEESEPRRETGMQHLVAVVDPLVEFACPDHTLKVPHLRELNEFASREIAFDPWKLRTDQDGLALIVRAHDSAETLYPLPHRDLLLKLFDLVGVKAQLSSPGLIADNIIHGMREADPLEACRVFKIRGVRKLLKDIRTEEASPWKDAVAAIGRAEFRKFKRLYIAPRETPELTPSDVMKYLLEKRVLGPKLRLWSRLVRRQHDFRCRACGLRSRIPLRTFEGSWSCPFCDKTQDLRPLVVTEFRRERPDWLFKRAGFFAKDNNQEGALPVILTLLQLNRVLDSSDFIYSTACSLETTDGHKCETDFVVLQYGHYGTIELGIGECKDEGGTITDDDIQKLKVVAARFSGRNIKPFLIFAKTADAFRPTELNEFRRLAAEDNPPVLMTNAELEP